ncbi:hypothetical protein JW960_27535 [candidate division KSB1 bacterium]|nr:hypothetical protein [candidate division KSB1 bacterium]
MQRIVLLIILLVVSACAITRPYHIQTIKDEAEFYNHKQVIVSGEVIQVLALPFIEKGFCKIDDGSDDIWVKPASQVAKHGERLTIRGTVMTGFSIGNRTFGIIIVEDEPEE